MADTEATVQSLRDRVQAFVHERDWEQFHSAKELAAAIAIEAAELMEPFLWITASEAEEALAASQTRAQVEEELADVLILCLSLANRLAVDVTSIVTAKLEVNMSEFGPGCAQPYQPATWPS